MVSPQAMLIVIVWYQLQNKRSDEKQICDVWMCVWMYVWICACNSALVGRKNECERRRGVYFEWLLKEENLCCANERIVDEKKKLRVNEKNDYEWKNYGWVTEEMNVQNYVWMVYEKKNCVWVKEEVSMKN